MIYVLLCIKALELTNVTRAIVWRCSRVKVFIGVVWTCVMYGLYVLAVLDDDLDDVDDI